MDSSTVGRRIRAALVSACALALILSAPALAATGEERFGGVGLQVVPTAGGELVVLQVLDDSPAGEKGLKPGDFIVRVDGRALAGSDFTEVVSELLWGRVGTTVTLRFLRPGVAGERSVTLSRIPIKSDPQPTPGVRMITPEEPEDSGSDGSLSQ